MIYKNKKKAFTGNNITFQGYDHYLEPFHRSEQKYHCLQNVGEHCTTLYPAWQVTGSVVYSYTG